MADYILSESMLLAAEHIANARLTLEEIGKLVGVDRRTIWNWRQIPAFTAEVERVSEERRREIRRLGIADLESRIAAQDDRWRRMTRLLEARGADPSMLEVAGGTTGLLVRTVKKVVVEDDTDSSDGRKRSQEVEEFAFDAALVRELRDLEKHTAQEMGQWVDKKSVEETRKSYDVANSPDIL